MEQLQTLIQLCVHEGMCDVNFVHEGPGRAQHNKLLHFFCPLFSCFALTKAQQGLYNQLQ